MVLVGNLSFLRATTVSVLGERATVSAEALSCLGSVLWLGLCSYSMDETELGDGCEDFGLVTGGGRGLRKRGSLPFDTSLCGSAILCGGERKGQCTLMDPPVHVLFSSITVNMYIVRILHALRMYMYMIFFSFVTILIIGGKRCW